MQNAYMANFGSNIQRVGTKEIDGTCRNLSSPSDCDLRSALAIIIIISDCTIWVVVSYEISEIE